MKSAFWKWVSPFAIFGFAILLLVVWGLFVKVLFNLVFIVLFTVFELIIEAASKANPAQIDSPLGKLIGKYPNHRDKYVTIIALVFWYIATGVSTMITGVSLGLVWVYLFGFLAYFGICFPFWSSERRNDARKAILRSFKGKKDISKSL